MTTSLMVKNFRSVYKALGIASHSVRFLGSNIPKGAIRSDQAGALRPLKHQFLPELSSKAQHKSPQDSSDPLSIRTLIRDETLLIRNQLIHPCVKKANHASQDSPTKLALIDGPLGVGKSTLLSQTVAYAREHGMIVMFIPNARSWTDGPGFFCPNVQEGLDLILHGSSAIRHFNRPTQMQHVFKNLLDAHGQTLAQMPCSMNHIANSSAQCESLRDLVLRGQDYLNKIDSNWQTIPPMAADVLDQVIRELSNSPDVPFALVIDDYHFLIGLTCMVNARKRRLHANSVRAIAQLFGRSAIEEFAFKIQNGFVALATEGNPRVMNWRRSRVISVSDFPLSDDILGDPSGRMWLKHLRRRAADPNDSRTLHIRVPDFLPGQLKAMCATISSGGLRSDHTDPEQRSASSRLVALAGGRGREMARIFAIR